MHRRPRFSRNGFGHKRGKTIVAQGRFADQAFEKEYLIGEFYRIAVAQIYLNLACTALLSDSINFKALGLCKIINVIYRVVWVMRR